MFEANHWKHHLMWFLVLTLAVVGAAFGAAYFYANRSTDFNIGYNEGILPADEVPGQTVVPPPLTITSPSVLDAVPTEPSPAATVPPVPLTTEPSPASLADQATPTASLAPPSALGNQADATQVIDVPILVYHSVMPHHPGQTKLQVRYDVAPEIFDRQMKYLKDNGFEVMAMSDLVQGLGSGLKPPAKAVVINFDDGYWNQYEYALPVLKKYGFTATFFVYTHALGREKFMTWEQVKDLARQGMTVGDHSATHPLLYAITDAAKLDVEVGASKQELEKAIGQPVNLFAYPFGKPSPEAEAAVRRAGYLAARIFQGGLLNSKQDLFVLRSVIVTDNFADFEKLLVGAGTVVNDSGKSE